MTMRLRIPKQKPSLKRLLSHSLILLVMLVVSLWSIADRQVTPASALTQSELRARSRELQTQIDENNAKAKEFQTQAASLESKINELQAEINSVNAQIELTSVKIADLQVDLEKAQAELERQKGLLKASMRALYKKGGASTVELLAASDSFSAFINDQEYLERLKVAIQDSTEKVIELKQQIQAQEEEQKALLEAQKGQRDTLASKQQEQNFLLNVTKGEQARYSQAAEELRQQQAAINAQLVSTVSGVDYTQTTSYPWADYEPWSFDSCYLDPWGMCVRQCVSYTAWKVAQSGRNMPYWGGRGNANQWDDDARADGIPVDGTPQAGDVAISNGGYYGHAMYVEAVYGNGQIRVSQFNFELQGKYSEMTINSSGLSFIHFPY